MRAKSTWTLQSFLTCLVWNGVLTGFFFLLARQILLGFHQWLDPILAAGDTTLPEDVRSGLLNLQQLYRQAEQYLIPVVFGAGGLITLVLWLFLLLQGRGLARRTLKEAQPLPGQAVISQAKPKKAEPAQTGVEAAPVAPPMPSPPSPQPAIQILSILQREGRLIDFLQEDLGLYEDAQIGAAVRSIHQGCKGALLEHVTLQPIYEEAENNEVTVPADFDARAVRLTGNVTGDPPFKGALRHRGWRVTRVDLPLAVTEEKKDWIVAPAEVEVGE